MKKRIITEFAGCMMVSDALSPALAQKKHKKAAKPAPAATAQPASVPAAPNIAAVPPDAPEPSRSLTPGSPDLTLSSDSLHKRHKVEIVPAPPPGNLPGYAPEKR